ncbi:MaoC/PaaZ C-terminal domain-containing protein [Amycolatopsis sp. NPDC049253]|uniref:MaoC family dehydratase n=1 Tax=Amycolatopsis sp. NPDC049253 TaxID=3155274 RepID=UPI0034299829
MRTTLSLTWDEIENGTTFSSPTRTITAGDVGTFAGLTGDHAEHHTSAVVAAQGAFGRQIAHGLLVLSCAHGLMLGDGLLRGSVDAFAGISDWKFVAPVFFGDTIKVNFSVVEKRESRSRPGKGILAFQVEVLNQDDVLVQRGRKVLFMSTSNGKSEE